MRKRGAVDTTTKLVMEALRASDDFMNYRMLTAATKRNYNQVSAACFHLRKRGAIDLVIETDGVGWWYALPAESDTRSRIVDERVPESKPRKMRKTRRKP